MTVPPDGPDEPLVERAVSLGGGHGQARTLEALRGLAARVTAIGTVADDGGSSGRLRRELDVLPPGDLRMALTTLAEDPLVRRLLEHRFTGGELAGHSLGNLVILAASELEGGEVAGLRAVARLAGTANDVLPSTTAVVHLAASTASGAPVVGQATIAATPGLESYRLVGQEPVACQEAVAAIEDAELIVLGPGSVVTSLLPNLLVPGIAAALAGTTAHTVFVANLDEQQGEGEDRSIADHLDLLRAACPELRVDTMITHDGPRPTTGRTPLRVDGAARSRVGTVVEADVLAAEGGHDAAALATALRSLVIADR